MLCAYCSTELVRIPSSDRVEKKAESERQYVSTEGDICPGTLQVNQDPSGKIPNNRNGLIQDVRVS